MPASATEHIDYYPPGWTETIHDETYIEWVSDDDPDMFVRLDGTDGPDQYIVTPVTGVNERGEEFVTRPVSGLDEATAFEVAATLVYALNGAIGRTRGDPEFTGGESE